MSEPPRKTKNIQNLVFGVILIALFALVCRLFAPFFSVLLWCILFYILFKPLHDKCTARLDRNKLRGKLAINVISAGFSIGIIFLILVPLSFAAFQLFRQIVESIKQLRDYMSSHSFNEMTILENISRVISDISSEQIVISADEIRARILGLLSTGLQSLIRASGNAARNVGSFFISLVFMVFSLYFMFVDGSYLSKLVLRVIPIKKEYLKTLVTKFKEITRQLVLGYIIIALAEAITAFVIFTVFRVTGSMVFATMVFCLSFFPLFGPTVVYIPLGLMRILNGNLWNGILLILVSAAFISTIDNILRPFILKDRIQLHPLIIFFAILGGISAFGLNGMILGPMAVIIFLTVFDLFLTEHKLDTNT